VSLFSSIDISGSGIDAMQTWIDASAGNIANANDATSTKTGTYAEQHAVFTPVGPTTPNGAGAGVAVSIVLSGTAGVLAPGSSNPNKDAQGNVRLPGISVSDQLVNLMQAQDGYQANTSAISRATAAYQAALTIGG
jgi:flagellar basal-body rod protein FlgC